MENAYVFYCDPAFTDAVHIIIINNKYFVLFDNNNHRLHRAKAPAKVRTTRTTARVGSTVRRVIFKLEKSSLFMIHGPGTHYRWLKKNQKVKSNRRYYSSSFA